MGCQVAEGILFMIRASKTTQRLHEHQLDQPLLYDFHLVTLLGWTTLERSLYKRMKMCITGSAALRLLCRRVSTSLCLPRPW